MKVKCLMSALLLSVLCDWSIAHAQSAIVFPSSKLEFHGGDTLSVAPLLSGPAIASAQCAATGLPPAVSIDPKSCAITGVLPLVPAPGLAFSVSVQSPLLSAPIALQLWVFSNMVNYPSSTPVFFAGDTVTFVPKLVGYAAAKMPNCAASGLPPGLAIDPNSCAITGLMGSSAPVGSVYMTTVNAFGAAPVNLRFEFDASGVVYPNTEYNFYAGDSVVMVPRLVGFSGMRPPGCAATGLPPGLQIDPLTCVISGTVGAVPPGGMAFSTAISAAGMGSPALLHFSLLASGLDYGAASLTLYSGDRIGLVPRKVGFGGRSPGCTATSLPPGLTIDPNTCAILGVAPMVPAVGQPFNATINVVGNPPVALQFVVISSAVLYPNLQPTFAPGDSVDLLPRVIGFTMIGANCAASGLPPGLYINPYTCEISGRAPSVSGVGQLFSLTVTASGLSPIAIQLQVLNP